MDPAKPNSLLERIKCEESLYIIFKCISKYNLCNYPYICMFFFKKNMSFFRSPVIEEEYFVPVEVENQPRNVAQMKDFGNRLAAEYDETEGPVMNLQDLEERPLRQSFLRQNDPNEGDTTEDLDDNAIRCIPKVMQVS